MPKEEPELLGLIRDHAPHSGKHFAPLPASPTRNDAFFACEAVPNMANHRADRPYRLIVTDNPCKTLGQGEVRYFPTLVQAANAFGNAPAPFRTIVYDDGCTARDLDEREQLFLETVCNTLGHDLEALEG